MADYDGTITIGAKLEIDKGSIRQQADKLKKSVEGVLGGKSSASSDSFSEIKDSAQNAIVEVDKLNQAVKEMAELKINIDGETFIGEIEKNLDLAKNKANDLQDVISKVKFNLPEENDGFEKTMQEIDKVRVQVQDTVSVENSVKGLVNLYLELSEAVNQYYTAMMNATGQTRDQIELDGSLASALSEIEQKLLSIGSNEALQALQDLTGGQLTPQPEFSPIPPMDEAKEEVSEVTEGFNKLNEAIFKSTKQTTNLLSELLKTSKEGSFSVDKMTKSFKKGLGMLLKYGLGIRSFFFLWRRLRTAVGDATKEMAKQIPEVNEVMSGLATSLNQVKGSLGTAFQPILSVVQPALVSLMNTLNQVITTIAKFFAVLSGQNYIYKATASQVDYAKSLDKTAKSAKNARKQLAGFDELNVISSQSGGGGGASATPTSEYEKEPIDPHFLEVVQKIKDILEFILPLVALIGALFLGWKIIGLLESLMKLSPILGTIAGIITLIVSLALACYNYIKMWEKGVNWKNLIGYVIGVVGVFASLYVLLGPVAAGLSLIIFGVLGLVLGLKDLMENGANTSNTFLILFSVIGLVVGVFLVFGSTVALIVGIIAGVIVILAALISWAGNGEEALGFLKDAFSDLGKMAKAVMEGDWDTALKYGKRALVNFANFFISCAEGIGNGFIKMVNVVIDAINNMLPEAFPDWMPIVGGNSFPKIPNWDATLKLPRLNVPKLATGAVIPANNPFLAMLGDQTSGTNIEAPLDTIVDAFNKAGGKSSEEELRLLRQQNELLTQILYKGLSISSKDLFNAVKSESKAYYNRTGNPAFI